MSLSISKSSILKIPSSSPEDNNRPQREHEMSKLALLSSVASDHQTTATGSINGEIPKITASSSTNNSSNSPSMDTPSSHSNTNSTSGGANNNNNNNGGAYYSFTVKGFNTITLGDGPSNRLTQVKQEILDTNAKTAPSAQVCSNCGTSQTPLWRRAPDGSTICNACGLYLKARNTQRPVKNKKASNNNFDDTNHAATTITNVNNNNTTNKHNNTESVLDPTTVDTATNPPNDAPSSARKTDSNGDSGVATPVKNAGSSSCSGEGTCPGDGHCNGTGGSLACSGCPALNNRLAKASHTNHSHNHNNTVNATSPSSNVTSPAGGDGSTSPANSNTSFIIKNGSDGEDLTNVACQNCGTTITPLWRRDDAGNTICNACGLYYRMHGHHRPMGMKKSTIKRRKRIINGQHPNTTNTNTNVQFSTFNVDSPPTTNNKLSTPPSSSPQFHNTTVPPNYNGKITLPPISSAAQPQQHSSLTAVTADRPHQQNFKPPPPPPSHSSQPTMSSPENTNDAAASSSQEDYISSSGGDKSYVPPPIDFTQSFKSSQQYSSTSEESFQGDATKLPSIQQLTDYKPKDQQQQQQSQSAVTTSSSSSEDSSHLKISSILNKPEKESTNTAAGPSSKNARSFSSSSSELNSSPQPANKKPKIDIPDYLAGSNHVREYLIEKRKKAEEKLTKQRQKLKEAELFLAACDDELKKYRFFFGEKSNLI